jgi:hypothetical protein
MLVTPTAGCTEENKKNGECAIPSLEATLCTQVLTLVIEIESCYPEFEIWRNSEGGMTDIAWRLRLTRRGYARISLHLRCKEGA